MAKDIGKKSKISSGLEGKYLTFALGKEIYGITILKVREIIGIGNLEIIAVPSMPDYANGVINLRDKVIPVISLRRRFAMAEAEYTDRTCIVVVEIATDKGLDLLMGVVVDSVSEVLNVAGEEIEPPPEFGVSVHTAFILGMAKVRGTVNILLDIDRVLTAEEIDLIAEAV
ncbi:MAG: chemotaxis protein CheW [Proteobacteria bacterium]|nr:chemotaxis protein CheW [Pseudomonadota bacterium]MBU1715608.1 chemotaxis protein CheW [Pseudomonadota bacterium]